MHPIARNVKCLFVDSHCRSFFFLVVFVLVPAERLKTISDNTARLRAYNASALDAAHAQVRRVALSPRSLPPHTSPSHRALDAAHAQLSKFVEEWAAAKVGSLTRPLSKPLYSALSKPLYSPP